MRNLGHFQTSSHDDIDAQTVIVIANAGSEIWKPFQNSMESQDGKANPLNRWTRRVLDTLGSDLGGQCVYPFDGPPFQPFQKWASLANPSIVASPIGIAIHPQWGLWWALRGAILIDHKLADLDQEIEPSPCEACPTKPCLTTCPVNAFTNPGYDVQACTSHISSEHSCVLNGCMARRACPIATELRYEGSHAQFHMSAFLGARISKE